MADSGMRPLSGRERQIVELVIEGCGNREIAERLGVRPQTVKNQLYMLFAKLGVHTRGELALRAVAPPAEEPATAVGVPQANERVA